jgi:superfamily II DNA helicase RecQ
VETDDVLAYLRRLKAACDGETTVIDAPRSDRDRVCLGIAERAGLCTLEPAFGGRLEVAFAASADAHEVASICRVARDRAWRAYRAIESFSSASAKCRRRALLDHFGDSRPVVPLGRCCDVCDPDTIGLPDPASLTPTRTKRHRGSNSAPVDPADLGLLETLRHWRVRASNGKPAYTVAHNSTLDAIATSRPRSLAELARIKGVGPAFVERHGQDVLTLVGSASEGETSAGA